MTVEELLTRFPEIPQNLHEEPLLKRFADAFGELLQVAHTPSPCSTHHDAANHYYLKLIGPLSIHGYGLTSRDKVEEQLRDLVERRRADPEGFAASLLPPETTEREQKGPGCE